MSPPTSHKLCKRIIVTWVHLLMAQLCPCRYVNGISSIVSNSVPVIAGLLSPVYFQFFMDKVFSNEKSLCLKCCYLDAVAKAGLRPM